jgi:hypothetical protein
MVDIYLREKAIRRNPGHPRSKKEKWANKHAKKMRRLERLRAKLGLRRFDTLIEAFAFTNLPV